jgi:hypothetical protein
LGTPAEDIRIKSLGKNSEFDVSQINSVKMLGSDVKVKWSQDADALIIKNSAKLPKWPVPGFKIEFKSYL